MSIYPYIKRGYKQTFDYDGYVQKGAREKIILKRNIYYDDAIPDMITKRLSDITTEDMKIMKCLCDDSIYSGGGLGYFGFTAWPETAAVYDMRMEVELEDGRVIEVPFKVDFSKEEALE